MAYFQQDILAERDVEQAFRVLKKGTSLLKYGRFGKPKFCPFRLSTDETMLVWYVGKDEKQLKLSHVSRIIPGQRTKIFQRYPQPEKEYQSFSLLYGNRSLDLICKDKDEAELWFSALRALISPADYCRSRSDSRSDTLSSDSSCNHTRNNSSSHVSSTSSDFASKDPGDTPAIKIPCENSSKKRLGKAFSDVLSCTATTKTCSRAESFAKSTSFLSSVGLDDTNSQSSKVDSSSISLSSAVSSTSGGSSHEEVDGLGDVFIWGEGLANGLLTGSVQGIGVSSVSRRDARVPKVLESTVVLDAHKIDCGSKHAVLVTKQGQIFSWGEGSGGRLGHGVEADVPHPKPIDGLSGLNINLVACGEFHTCAVTFSGDLYTWGDGTHQSGLLGRDSDVSHWNPRKVSGQLEGVHVSSISCGPWHTAAVTSAGKLFTFGDGTFGALGHGDRNSNSIPREVKVLKGLTTVMTSCGVWHTAAVVEVTIGNSNSNNSILSKKLFTWGDGAKGQLGHGDEKPRLVPCSVAVSDGANFCQVACGHSITVALTASGRVYAMGSADYGQLGKPGCTGKLPSCIKGNIRNRRIKEIACGAYHIVALSTEAEVYTWGKGENGQLGHGDIENRNTPTLVKYLKDKQVKHVVCGSNFTAAICLHKWISSADQSTCSGCRVPFNFRKKCHNCYNCGLVFCQTCSSKRSLRAALAPNTNKPFRVCDDCFTKLGEALESESTLNFPKTSIANRNHIYDEVAEKEDHSFRSRHLPRIASFDSLRRPKSGVPMTDRNSCHVSSTGNGSFQWESSYLFGHSKKASTFLPRSSMVNRLPSPISRKSTPRRSLTMNSAVASLAIPELTVNDSKQTNMGFAQETVILRAQVEDLTRKYQFLELEFERKSRQLEEANSIAQEEARKSKAAQEVIRSLSAQLKDLTGKIPK